MKYFAIAACLLITACGGSETPFGIVDPESQGNVLPQSDQTTTQTTTLDQTAATRGPCVDTAPLNDGWGWDGVSTCRTPITESPEPSALDIAIEQAVERGDIPAEDEEFMPTKIDDVFGDDLDCVIYGEDTLVPHTLRFESDGALIRVDKPTGAVSETTWIRNGDGVKLQNGLPLSFVDGKLTSGNMGGWEYTCAP